MIRRMSGVPTAMGYWAWRDVDPLRHTFDPSRVAPIAEAHVVQGGDRSAIEDAIDRALIAEYGMWVAGWRWASSEPGCGGLVQAWCCADHSLLCDGESTESSVARVVDAVKDWRAILEQLAELFAVLRHTNASVEHAAARLLTLVIERTDANDAWYRTYATVLGWYLESAGWDPSRTGPAIDKVIGGRFHSWVSPDDSVARETSAALEGAVTRAAQSEPEVRDVLREWLARRAPTLHHIGAETKRALVTVDAHRRWIDTVDEGRDAKRAARLRAALEQCRASARSGDRLTFETLATWQAILLGTQGEQFRTTDAFAKGGRERYAIASDTRSRFEAALDEANDLRVAAATRAAKAYLDVCFFHPFEDGNARAARLVLDHVLMRAGLALHAVEPVFVVSRAADDPRGAWGLAYVIDHLAGRNGLA